MTGYGRFIGDSGEHQRRRWQRRVGRVGRPPAGWAGDYTPGEREFHEIVCQLADRAWRQGYGIEAVVALADLVDWFPPTDHPPSLGLPDSFQM